MRFSSIFTASTALATVASAAPFLLPRAALKPRNDPFYVPPSNLSSYSAGDIIRSRPTPEPIEGIFPDGTTNISASYQILYRTRDAIGNASASVATILIPYNADYEKLLAYEFAYDSSDVNCSPSYSLQEGSNSTNYDVALVAAALEQGWVVTTSDYEGLDASFVAGLVSGYGVLDSVRATLASGDITGVEETAVYALWGYSGGALGSEWALELQPGYAPDLHFAGAALGGLTPNALTVAELANGSVFASLAFSGINGLASAYPNLTTWLDDNLVPATAAEFREADYQCTNSNYSNSMYSGQDVWSYFKNGYESIVSDPVPSSVLHWGATMGLHGTPQPPLFVYKAIGDEVSPVNETDALVNKYCAQGATIQYERNKVGEHVTEALLGAPHALGFLTDRLNGVSVKSGCSIQNVTIEAVDLENVEGLTEVLTSVLQEILQLPIGPASFTGL